MCTDPRPMDGDPRDEQARGQASWEMPRERPRRTRIRHGLWGTARHPAFRPGLGFYSSGFYTGRFLSTSLNRSNSVWLPFPAREKCETVISSFFAYCCEIKKNARKISHIFSTLCTISAIAQFVIYKLQELNMTKLNKFRKLLIIN